MPKQKEENCFLEKRKYFFVSQTNKENFNCQQESQEDNSTFCYWSI